MGAVNKLDITNTKYQDLRDLISKYRDSGIEWSAIKWANTGSEQGLRGFLERAIKEHCWPDDATVELWYAVVESEMEGERKQKDSAKRTLVHG